jgi:hypothetical protein
MLFTVIPQKDVFPSILFSLKVKTLPTNDSIKINNYAVFYIAK